MPRFFLLSLAVGFAAALLAAAKGRSVFSWFFLGVFFPVSLLILLFLPDLKAQESKKCPSCLYPVDKESQSCPNCGRSLSVNISMVKCRACGVIVQDGKRCERCGAHLN